MDEENTDDGAAWLACFLLCLLVAAGTMTMAFLKATGG
jgi:hypothetical protein